jgi:SAM-dependent methyltransferase
MGEQKEFRRAHFLLGLEGLAILRRWWLDPAAVEARAAEIADIMNTMESDEFLSAPRDVPETGPLKGYARWAETYDDPGNPVVSAEERGMRPLLDELDGRVLDAGCGTGRHARYLTDRGLDVVGVDQSPEMLARAVADNMSELCQAVVTELPLADGAFDATVCALVLAHFPDLGQPMTELIRVIRPGGTLLISDIHPLAVALGGHAAYSGSDDRLGVIRNYLHQHSDYLRVFRALGLEVEACLEPVWTDTELDFMRNAYLSGRTSPRDLAHEAVEGLPIVLIWKLRKLREKAGT